MKWFIYGALFLGMATPLSAASISYTWTAERDRIIDAPDDGSTAADILAFDLISGTLTYDTDATDTLPDSRGNYITGVLTLDQVALGAPVPRSERTFILNDRSGVDTIRFSTLFTGVSIALSLRDSGGTALSDDSVPTSLSLADFPDNPYVLFTRSGADLNPAGLYSLTSLEQVAPVPLPAGLPMLGAGVLCLGLLSRRRS